MGNPIVTETYTSDPAVLVHNGTVYLYTGHDEAPLGVGSRYRLGVRMGGRVAPMDYQVTAFEPGRRVVLAGTGRGVRAIDDIRFTPTDTGTRIDYVADIRLVGVLRPAGPFAAGALARIGQAARDGMERALARLAVAA